ncbi:MAG: hypothetical protein GX846_07580 [Deltaproteobacteria bacterium]|nr:hypothetical protein [Deltaproteobacteria bacterium]
MIAVIMRISFLALLMAGLGTNISCNSNGEANSQTETPTASDNRVEPPPENNDVSDLPGTGSIIIDHENTNLAMVPLKWINKAKSELHIAYGHTSHGSQITTGMAGLINFANAPNGGSTYRWNNGGSDNALDLRDSPFSGASDLGNPNRTAWADATRNYLNGHPEINVIMWSWCGQANGTEEEIDLYLDLMSDLEEDYPGVMFVYMTGHTDGTGLNGNLHQRNTQIREFCEANGKILFDFEDIESYDPDGEYYGDLNVTDSCNYNGGNWAVEWQESHTKGVDWYDCLSAHSEPLNSNQKAYAAWWLWARLAGWDGN